MADNIKEKIKDRVMDCIIAGAGGRLVVFKPEKPDIDLIVEKRADYEKKKIFLKIISQQGACQNFNPRKAISQFNDKNQKEDFYFLFICFDEFLQKLDDNLAIMPDKLFINKKELTSFLLNKIG